MLQVEKVDANNYKKSSEVYIPMNTYKYFTKKIEELWIRFCEIDKKLNNRETKVEPSELGNLRLEQEQISKKMQEYSQILQTKHTIIEISDQNEKCLLGNRVKVLIDNKIKKVYLDACSTKTGTVSISSPFGISIFGKAVGDIVEFTNPNNGTTVTVEILEIENHKNSKKIFKQEESRKDISQPMSHAG